MDIKTFDRLRKYETTSWACWSDDGDCSVEFFRSQLENLHGRAVFVGLNRSEAWQDHLESTNMSNFHTPGHTGDRRLKRYIQDASLHNLIGGFMTDVSEEVKSDSSSVSVDAARATAFLVEKIIAVDRSTNRNIIGFGDKAFNIIRKGLGVPNNIVSEHLLSKTKQFVTNVSNETWNVFRVWHPGNYGKFIHKSEQELPLQLIFINEQTHLRNN